MAKILNLLPEITFHLLFDRQHLISVILDRTVLLHKAWSPLVFRFYCLLSFLPFPHLEDCLIPPLQTEFKPRFWDSNPHLQKIWEGLFYQQFSVLAVVEISLNSWALP